MVELTLFEIHLDGAEFTANAPGSGALEDPDGVAPDVDAEDDGGSGPLPAVLALVVLVVLAVVVRRLVGGSGDDED